MKYSHFLFVCVLLLITIFLIKFANSKGNAKVIEDNSMYKKLTPEEENVIVHKGTERPFTGKYNDFNETGLYICKRCEFPLFESYSKFKSECGWPSFDEQIPGRSNLPARC